MAATTIDTMPQEAKVEHASIRVHARDGDRVIFLHGPWTMRHLGDVDAEIRALQPVQGRTVLDFSEVTALDTAGAWVVDRFARRIEGAGGASVINIAPKQATLLDAVTRLPHADDAPTRPKPGLLDRMLAPIGRTMHELWIDIRAGLSILGAAISGEKSGKEGGRGLGITPVVAQLDAMAVKAVPIVGLMSFLIGAIVAQQGAFQLRFVAGPGTEIFAVDLVSILLLREIGVMLTAIMVAGRTGSAITAEIGSMKMREEIDALKVIGLNPIATLVFPRLVALAFALPLLTVVSCFFALVGGAVVLLLYADLPLAIQIAQLSQAIDITTITAGIVKAPFMALIIGIVASLEGLQVGGSAESLGRRVTAAVVKSIFLVIFIDGLFAIFYAQIGF